MPGKRVSSGQPATGPRPRITIIDVARGIALLAMTVYHFTWDLEFFGWILPGTIQQSGWVLFARSIAFSFLFLVGVSLVLGHDSEIRWPDFWKRFAKVAAGAALISLGTWFAFRQGFIFFGILHAIALFSIFALPFVRQSWLFSAVAAAAITGVWSSFTAPLFGNSALLWVGLSPTPIASNDYVPLFPWFAAVLLGIVATKLATTGFWNRLASISLPSLVQRPLIFIGQHSLIYYLLHQLVLMGGLWVFTQVAGPPDRTASFIHLCSRECAQTRDANFCRAYCSCTMESFKDAKLFTPFLDGEIDMTTNREIRKVVDICSTRSNN